MFETLNRLNNTIDPLLVVYVGAGLFALTFLALAMFESRRRNKERQKRAHS